MNDLSLSRLWAMRASFLFLALVILFFHLLPMETTPRRWGPTCCCVLPVPGACGARNMCLPSRWPSPF
ncbi:hypothetical protein ACFQFQ_18900 [Sulfitobacter porphyrae]|uniref:Uncharacterized protein n=1 Tax=Sulfitobacter porphyrae TaxID=1246864 RepID=A0ABW2B647_9RHOB